MSQYFFTKCTFTCNPFIFQKSIILHHQLVRLKLNRTRVGPNANGAKWVHFRGVARASNFFSPRYLSAFIESSNLIPSTNAMYFGRELIEKIEDDETVNFRELLEQYSKAVSASGDELDYSVMLINTVELFAFGDCLAYARNKDKYIELSEKAQRKLVVLSVLSVLSKNAGNHVSFDEILHVLAPLEFNSKTMESVLISMSEAKMLDVKIDEESRSVKVTDVYVLRDAYNENSYKLRVLNKDDLAVMSVSNAREVLQRWLDGSIAPVAQELGD